MNDENENDGDYLAEEMFLLQASLHENRSLKKDLRTHKSLLLSL